MENNTGRKEPARLVDRLASKINKPFTALISKINRGRRSVEEPTPQVVSETTSRFEKEHSVREAPLLKNIIVDESRMNKFQYWRSKGSTRRLRQMGQVVPDNERVELTEHEGLTQLDQFLEQAAFELKQVEDNGSVGLGKRAEELREKLTYIGQKEFEEAARGIADLWKSYLLANVAAELRVPLGVVRTNERVKKSGEYLFDRVMSNFSQQELQVFRGRIKTDLDRLPKNVANVKIILLDDWSISGTQLNNGYANVLEAAGRLNGIEDRIEVNLVAATKKQISEPELQGREVPFFAYFHMDSDDREPLVTGTHSSVDFNFETPIERMVEDLNKKHPDDLVEMPACTNIIRQQYS